MESLITKLFFYEDRLSPNDNDEKRIEALLSEKEKIIESALNLEQKKAFNEYDTLKNEQSANVCLTAYCEGFKYGVKLFAEALKTEK